MIMGGVFRKPDTGTDLESSGLNRTGLVGSITDGVQDMGYKP